MLACRAAAAADPSDSLPNGNTIALLSEYRSVLHKLDFPPPDDGASQPKIYFDTAADCLTALYQQYGCEWAADELRLLYAREPTPPLRLGYSADGRVLLRVEPLELQNLAYVEWTVLLCTLRSETARDLHGDAASSLRVTLPDGAVLRAELVTEAHALWPQLERMADQFAPPAELPSGAGIGFKQLYAIPRSSLPLNQCAVSLAWGGYEIVLPTWTGQEAADG
jgi:hypothetical protein